MQYKIFYIPVANAEQTEAAMNAFLRGQMLISVRKDLIQDGGSWIWLFLVEYSQSPNAQKGFAQRGEMVDYRTLLSPEDFSLFLKLKELRKRLAAEKAVPVFTIFTNEQLADIARKRPLSAAAFKDCDGLGEAKVRDFGEAVLALIRGSGTEGPPRNA